ncbi:MAG: DNA repair protein RadA, partial [Weeksellaceae bacterium]|nr:DNA repair protein RadA [Weeksellaceae bacterium]
MAKVKTSFYCQNCGNQYSQWMGQCKACGEWNTIVEEITAKDNEKKPWRESNPSKN